MGWPWDVNQINGREIFSVRERIGIANLLFTDDLVLCSESEEDLKIIGQHFVE